MHTFKEFAQNKNISIIANDIIEELSFYADPYLVLEDMFIENYGVKNIHFFIEAFDGQSGSWGNFWNGLKGMGQSALGALGAGAGGLAGGAAGTMGGLARSAGNITTGQGTAAVNPNDPGAGLQSTMGGVQAGSSWGKNIWNQGVNAAKNAWGNRYNAQIVSGYKNSVQALDAYIKAISALPTTQPLANELGKVKNSLEKASQKIDNIMNKPQHQQNQQNQQPQQTIPFPQPQQIQNQQSQ
jgi:hypothetical protein